MTTSVHNSSSHTLEVCLNQKIPEADIEHVILKQNLGVEALRSLTDHNADKVELLQLIVFPLLC